MLERGCNILLTIYAQRARFIYLLSDKKVGALRGFASPGEQIPVPPILEKHYKLPGPRYQRGPERGHILPINSEGPSGHLFSLNGGQRSPKGPRRGKEKGNDNVRRKVTDCFLIFDFFVVFLVDPKGAQSAGSSVNLTSSLSLPEGANQSFQPIYALRAYWLFSCPKGGPFGTVRALWAYIGKEAGHILLKA